MRSFIRHSIIAFGFGALVIMTVYRPGLEPIAHARSVANGSWTNALRTSAYRESREAVADAFSLSSQGAAVRTPTVSPNSINVSSQNPTSALLTFSGVINLKPKKATFCKELVAIFSNDPVGGSFGFQCKPGSIFGQLPGAYDQSVLSQNNTFTDIVTFTREKARRFYIEAVRRNTDTIFYVRLFEDMTTHHVVGVPVTLHLSGNGAGVPFSLTEVKLKFVAFNKPILFVKTGEELPRFQAEITFTGAGNFKGHWDLVKPGDLLPGHRDRLTQATLPTEQRGVQEGYTEMSRFNVYLPPSGQFVLPGPDTSSVDTSLTGSYRILLRIEATPDPQGSVPAPGTAGETRLAAALRRVDGGAVAGFALPELRFYVSNGSVTAQPPTVSSNNPLVCCWSVVFGVSFSPEDQATLDPNQPVAFTWPVDNATKYRFEVEDLQGTPIISAILPAGVNAYRAPSWFKDKVAKQVARWRVISFDQEGNEVDKTEWRALRFVGGTDGTNQQK